MAKDRLIGNVSATYDITDDLNLMIRAGRDNFSEYRFIKRAYSTSDFPMDSTGKTKSILVKQILIFF
jgi:hypothetical protein